MPAEVAQQLGNLLLLFDGKRGCNFGYALRMFRENAAHECLAIGGERGIARAPVFGAQAAFDQAALLEAVDQVSDAAARHQDLLLHFAQEELTFVVERFHDGELGEGETVASDVAGGALANSRIGPGKDDPEFEGSSLLVHI